MLDVAYHRGNGVEKDYAAALKWLELADEQGCHTGVLLQTGHIHDEGGYGVTKDESAAFTWYTGATDGGNVYAQYMIAARLYSGLGGAVKDPAEARSWFKKSSDQGDVRAQRRLGVMMATGEGGEKDVPQGVALVEAAAGKGDPTAIELVRNHNAFIAASWCQSAQ
jgi:TPR repeat protein